MIFPDPCQPYSIYTVKSLKIATSSSSIFHDDKTSEVMHLAREKIENIPLDDCLDVFGKHIAHKFHGLKRK